MKILTSRLLLFSLFLTAVSGYVRAQDPHFTQAHRIPSWYNPAAAGHGVEHIRLTLLYRNQWASVTSPFRTEALFFDKQVSRVGFGANLVNNTSGDAGIRQLFLNGQLSYRYTTGKHTIAGGLQVGLIQKSFDPSKMTFDDQYTQDQGFNPANPTQETFSYTKLTRPDFGTGILWSCGTAGKDRFFPYAGLSLQHINQPKESFIEDNNFIPRKLTAQAGVGIHLNEALVLTPTVLYASQQSAQELMGAVMLKMPLDGRDHVEGGVIYRNRDAGALYAGYQRNSFMFGVSYDVNISGLTGGPGAFELTLTYIPKAKIKKEAKPKKEKDKKDTKPAVKKTTVTSKAPTTATKVLPPQATPAPASPSGKPVTGAVSPSTKSNASPAVGNTVKATEKPTPAAAIKTEEKLPPVSMAVLKPLPTRVQTTVEKPQPKHKANIHQTGLPIHSPETEEAAAVRKPSESLNKATMKPLPSLTKKEKAIPAPQRTISQQVNALPLEIQETEPNEVIRKSATVISPLTYDSDADGMADSIDHCPYIKGLKAFEGCPDTDGDGIPDMKDDCPLLAGDKEHKGCVAKETPAVSGPVISQHFGNIEFKTSGTEVHGLYKLDIIEPALDSLFEHEDLILVITGHTDSEGDAQFNMELSQARTEVVKAIFMRKGLPEERIRTVAYGETMPLRENISENGRQRNRRAEIHVIQKKKP